MKKKSSGEGDPCHLFWPALNFPLGGIGPKVNTNVWGHEYFIPTKFGKYHPSYSVVKDKPNFISSGSKIVKQLRRRQCDPLIIERTIGLVIGPSTALYRPSLKHCTLTNKAVGTIWRALSIPPQMRQGSDLRPLWLLVGTPSAIRPELASRRAKHSLPYSDVTIYILLIYNVYHLCCMCIDLYDLSTGGGCLFVVYIRTIIYKFLNGCPFNSCGKWEGKARIPVNHTSWVVVGTPTDRPKSVRNCCVIEHFVALLVLSLCPFDFSAGVGAFVSLPHKHL